MNGKELRSFSHFQIWTWIAYSDLSRNLENWPILKFVLIHCQTMRVSQNDQIQMYRWFTSVFLMNGKELRSFSDFQIFTWIAYSDLSWNLENWLILKFFLIHCQTMRVSQNDQIQMYRWFTCVFLINGIELRSFSRYQIRPRSHTRTLGENLKID